MNIENQIISEIGNNIPERYKMRILVHDMLQTSLQNKKPNVYNVLTNYLTFFIFINLNQSVNIKKELNNIFDKKLFS